MREEYIDSFKGLGILGVVIIHLPYAGMPGWLLGFAVHWAVYSFFFISGWLYAVKGEKRSPGSHFRRRLRRLGIPYVFFSILFILIDAAGVSIGTVEGERLLKDVYKTFVLRGIGTLWFLPVLLFAETLFVACRAFRKHAVAVTSSSLVILSAMVAGVAGFSHALFLSGRVGQAVFQILVTLNLIGEAVICMALGYMSALCIRPVADRLEKRFGPLCTGVSGIVLLITTNLLISALSGHNLMFVRMLTVIPMSFAVMLLMKSMQKSLTVRFFGFWGRNSLMMMCTHYSVTLPLIGVVDNLFAGGIYREASGTWVYLVLCIGLTYAAKRFVSEVASRYLPSWVYDNRHWYLSGITGRGNKRMIIADDDSKEQSYKMNLH